MMELQMTKDREDPSNVVTCVCGAERAGWCCAPSQRACTYKLETPIGTGCEKRKDLKIKND